MICRGGLDKEGGRMAPLGFGRDYVSNSALKADTFRDCKDEVVILP